MPRSESALQELLIGSATAQDVGSFSTHFTDEKMKATGEAVDSQASQLASKGGPERQARP